MRALARRGLADRLLSHAQKHGACEFRWVGERHRFGYEELSGHRHFVYPQPLLVTDLVGAYADRAGGDIRFGVRDVELHGLDTDRPSVSYTDPGTGERTHIECDAVAGCDGARGVTRSPATTWSARPATTPRTGRTSASGPNCTPASRWRERHRSTEGPLIEKRVLDMHNYVVEPMSYGRLYLAGDSAHLAAPIAAKGMNLALRRPVARRRTRRLLR